MSIQRILIALVVTLASVYAHASPLPDQSEAKHLGVASCASSTCHGSLSERNRTRVLQNEFVTWSRFDPHSRAMNTLRNEQSKRIVKNLGLKKPAYQEPLCMDCHLDNPPVEAQGKRFTHNDGIGCEACHGGAENWIKSHTNKGRKFSANVADGMYPTDEPESRAKLCLSCHLGNEDKFATHRIMGAGHPRLSFELQTFTELQPVHYRVDADYTARKGGTDPINTWMTGVYQNAITWLNAVDSHWIADNSIFPEPALFDCHACHHPMSEQRWRPKSTKPTPGNIRLADSHIMMVWALTSHLQPKQHPELVDWLHQLHRASTTSIDELKKAARNGVALMNKLSANQTSRTLSPYQRRALLTRIVNGGQTGLFDDYAAAEQAAFAVQLLLREQNPARFTAVSGPLFESVANEDEFDIQRFRKAIGQALK